MCERDGSAATVEAVKKMMTKAFETVHAPRAPARSMHVALSAAWCGAARAGERLAGGGQGNRLEPVGDDRGLARRLTSPTVPPAGPVRAHGGGKRAEGSPARQVASLVFGPEGARYIVTANAGDSRSVLAYEEDGAIKVTDLSDDQKPDREDERVRIQQVRPAPPRVCV